MRQRLLLKLGLFGIAGALVVGAAGMSTTALGFSMDRLAGSSATTISMDQAQQSVQSFLDRIGNNDLKIDELMEFQQNFYAIAKEKSTGIGAYELLVNKHSGAVSFEPGPNMMWNNKYSAMGRMGVTGGSWMSRLWIGSGIDTGMGAGTHGSGVGTGTHGSGMGTGTHSSGMGTGANGSGMGSGANGSGMGTAGPIGAPTSDAAMAVTSGRATQIAQTWLDNQSGGTSAGTADAFHGYYTLHFQRAGQIAGMLSVNGSSGQVWLHTWHGSFVQVRDLGQ